MNILHVYKDYCPVYGGIENHLKLLAESQAAAGHRVTVLVTRAGLGTREQNIDGVRVIKAGRLAVVASTPLSPSLPWLLWRQRPEITHLHFPYPVGEVANHWLGRSQRTVMTYHSDVVRQKAILSLYRPLMERVLTSVDRIIVATPNYLSSSAVLRRHRQKCEVIPYGIDQERFRRADPQAVHALRQQHGGSAVLLFVGVLRYYKGLQHLIQAMPGIPARLLVVGEGPMGPALREQAGRLQLEDKVVFVGRVSDQDLVNYYHAADLFVLPSSERSEAYGIVQVEAMTCGLPVICTELGTGTSYVNRHGESGLVVAPRDPAALARAINGLLADPDRRRRLARGAARRARLFTRERMVEAIQRLYEELLRGAAKGSI